jgi:hypothetical protein
MILDLYNVVGQADRYPLILLELSPLRHLRPLMKVIQESGKLGSLLSTIHVVEDNDKFLAS